MLSGEVGIRYARALFDSARERGYLDQADEQLGALQSALRDDPGFVQYLLAPQITDEQKEGLIHRLFDSVFEKPVVEFLILLARKRRVDYLPETLERFRELVADERGILNVVATSARPLPDDQKHQLIERLRIKTGKAIELVERHDKQALGGVSVRIKDHVYDGTVRSELQALREMLDALEVV
ncbi:MAG: ATP synthase F1 subunit delta [candidate division Zixibacteria bacterium]|nr:ATP synthase F1 subunit delta [candidate division Zixibacteria bacterium]